MLQFRSRVAALAAGLGFALGLLMFRNPVVAAADGLLMGGILWLRMGH